MNSIPKLTAQQREYLLSKSFFMLPDNPSDKNFSPGQIKKRGYEGLLVLFEYINGLIEALNVNVTASNKDIADINETLDGLTGGVTFISVEDDDYVIPEGSE